MLPPAISSTNPAPEPPIEGGKAAVEAAQRTQLIVTTQSDAIVSALSEHTNSVLVCEHKGGTVLRRLDPDKLRYWLDQYRLGDIWRIGELGGNP